MIRKDHSPELLRSLCRIFIFLVNCNSRVYYRATLVSLTCLLRSRRLHTPVWDVFTTTATAWNEEEGEISLSHLGRTVSHDPITNNLDHMRDTYLLLGTQLGMKEPGKEKLARTKRGGVYVQPHSELIWKVANHFIKSIEEIRSGTYRVYVGDEENWVNSSVAMTSAVDDVKVDSWAPTISSDYIHKLTEDYKRLVAKSCWVSKVIEAEDNDDEKDEAQGVPFLYTYRIL